MQAEADRLQAVLSGTVSEQGVTIEPSGAD